MDGSIQQGSRVRGLRRRLAELLVRVRTEGGSPVRVTLAVAVGAFIGCTPLFGFHLALCVAVGWVFGLNRLTMYLAAHLNNPLVAPLVVFLEVQTGSWIRTGRTYKLAVAELERMDLAGFAADLAVGTLVVGGAVALAAGAATWVVLRRAAGRDPWVRQLVEDAARPFLDCGFSHWEFVRSKLRWDPVFLYLARSGVLPSGGRVVDLGCGRGILLALLAALDQPQRLRDRPAGWQPPRDLELVGVEARARTVRVARAALAGLATVEQGDVRQWPLDPCRAVVLLDVLHYLDIGDQDRLLDRVAAALEPGGVVVIREADAVGSRAFLMTRWSERLRSVLRGQPVYRFGFRPVAEIEARLAAAGLTVETVPMSDRTPFANVLVIGRREGR